MGFPWDSRTIFPLFRTNAALPDFSDCLASKTEHAWFIRLLNGLPFGTSLKALNAFKTFLIYLNIEPA